MPREQKGYGRPRDTKKTILRLLSYLGRYKGVIAVIIPALIVSSVAGVAGTYMLKPIINQIAEYASSGMTDESCIRSLRRVNAKIAQGNVSHLKAL